MQIIVGFGWMRRFTVSRRASGGIKTKSAEEGSRVEGMKGQWLSKTMI
jgi:hypothetical protein